MEIGRIHIITPPDGSPITSAAEAASAGAPVIQLRLKDMSDRARFEVARRVSDVCAVNGTRLIINDRADIAQVADADGVHLGADDLPVEAVRRVLGPGRLIGATARNPDSARAAEAAGATYLGVGPAYLTSTKDGLPDPLGPERIGEIASAVRIPVIAIGGVTPERIPSLLAAGAHGVAVVRAVWSAPNPADVVRQMLTLIEEAS